MFCISQSLAAQQIARCNTDQYMIEYLQDQKRANDFYKQQKAIRKKVDFSQRISCVTTIMIPVAVHFSGDIDGSDMSCLEDIVDAQIAVLNEDYSGTNADIAGYDDFTNNCSANFPASALGTGACLEFCLAKYNHPAGSSLSDGDKAITIGEEDWPTAPDWSGYLNFFVTDQIGFLGQAPVNGGANPNGNGVQVLASAFGGPGVTCFSGAWLNSSNTYNLGRTGTHELGHYFNLKHIFDGCGNGDDMPDTPDQSLENFNCPSLDINTCDTDAHNTCSEKDFFFNFMDYVDDDCMFMFTEDQCQEMFNSADHDSWADNTLVCEAPAIPVASFTPTADQSFCADDATFQFFDTSSNDPNTWSWTFTGPGVSPTSSVAENPSVTFTATGNYTVSLTATNSSGSDTHTETIYVEVLPLSDPTCDLCEYELILWDRKEDGWTAAQSIDLTINGTTTVYNGPGNNNLSQHILFDVFLNDAIDIALTPGSGTDADEISWRLFDEEGRVVLGDGDSFGFGPVNNQGSNGPTLNAPTTGVHSYTGNCDAVLNCEDYQLEITLDDYAVETAWWMKDDQGNLEYQSLGYEGEGGNTLFIDMCLVEGCHDFTILDFYGDGMCCSYGNGAYEITKVSTGTVVASGGTFTGSETTEICVNFGPTCEATLNLSGNLLNTTYAVTDEIFSDGTVKDDTTTVLHAPNLITLNYPFEVKFGGDFTAELDICVDPLAENDPSYFLTGENGDMLVFNTKKMLQLIDANGSLVQAFPAQTNTTKRTISNVDQGIYFIKYFDGNSQFIEKVFIK